MLNAGTLAAVSAAVVLVLEGAVLTAITRLHAPSPPPDFPRGYTSGVLYATVDRPDVKQVRDLFAPAEAIEAIRSGRPMADGTVLTLLLYAAKTDRVGNPSPDARGRLIKNGFLGYSVMEKRQGQSGAPSPDLRNGDWSYQSFTSNKTVNANAHLSDCYQCHLSRSRQDYVFSDDKMRAHTAALSRP